MKNYYQILGVEQTADVERIKKAYRKLALKYHPDNCARSDAESKFEEVTEAYNVLTSEKKRHQYDKKLAQQQRKRDPFSQDLSHQRSKHRQQYSFETGDLDDFEKKLEELFEFNLRTKRKRDNESKERQ